jgi:hypothetical protein
MANVDAVNLTNPQQIISALRNKKAFSYYLPSRTKQAYRKEIAHSSMEKLTHLIKIPGSLPQTSLPILAETEALDLHRELAVTT